MDIYIASSYEKSVLESVVDGKGLRLVVFFTGCAHRCDGCHNPKSWVMENGQKVDTQELADYILSRLSDGRYAGITLSGGDPYYQEEAVCELVDLLKEKIPDLNIWCYTGYTYDEIKDHLLTKKIDTLVDGPFIKTQMLPKKPFRGSANQRVLHLKNSEIMREE